MKSIKLWPHAAILGLIIAVAAGAGVWIYQRNSTNAEAAALPYAAQLQRVDGEVAVSDGNYTEWRAVGKNEPYSVGDRLYTRENAHASVAFNGRNYARLNPNTALDAVVLTDTQTQLALRDGAAMFDVGYLPSGGLYEVGTPYGAVDFSEPGLYYVDVSRGNAIVSVLSGVAQVVGLAGSGRVSKGEMLTLLGATAADVVLARLDGRNAGYLVDDYYRYQYPNVYDGRYVSYDTYLADPFYFDPYRNDLSYKYVTYIVPGVNDLSYYGDWRQVDNYGYAWAPRVDAGWTPYSSGYWINDYPYGLTWVSTEPWGYAPYHYGRWSFVGDRWYWIPDSVNATPRYSPALVAFFQMGDNQIGWVPLGPGDPYVYRYYDENWQPHYLSRGDVIAANLVNLAVPNAVTVVPLDAFGRPIDPRVVTHVNPSMITQVRPTLEPLLLTPLRNAALRSAWGRGKIDLPPGIAKKLQDTSVIVSTAPVAPPFRKDLDKTLRVERVSEKVKNQNFKIRDDRNLGTSQNDAGRKQEMDRLSQEAARGNKQAERQVRQLEQQQQKDERAQPKVQQKAAPPVRGERVGNPAKPNPVKPATPPPAKANPNPVRPNPVRANPNPVRTNPNPVRSKPNPVRANPAKPNPGPPARGGANKQPPGKGKPPGGKPKGKP